MTGQTEARGGVDRPLGIIRRDGWIMRPARQEPVLFRDMPSMADIASLELTSFPAASGGSFLCSHCRQPLREAVMNGGRGFYAWDTAGEGGWRLICNDCQPSIEAALAEATRGRHTETGRPVDVPLMDTLLLISRVSFLRYLAAQRTVTTPVPCGWCQLATPHAPREERSHNICRRQMTRCASFAAVRGDRVRLIARLPLPGDVLGVICRWTAALCDPWEALGAAADLLLAGYRVGPV